MSDLVAPLLVSLLLVNLYALGTSRLLAAVNASAAQGAILGALTLAVHREVSVRTALVALGATALKGVAIPRMLRRAMRDVPVRREAEPLVGYAASLFLGASGTGLAVLFADTLPLAREHVGSLLVPAALSTVLTGFIVMTTRRKAISQVVGYLILENGIFVMGLSLMAAMPFLVEFGVLLDLFVGIFVMGIIVDHIRREFASLDTERLSALKE